MKLFDLQLDTSLSKEEILYFRKRDCKIDNSNVLFNKGSILSFDTYFNCLSFSKIKKHTSLSKLYYHLSLDGDFRILTRKVILNNDIEEKFIDFNRCVTRDIDFNYPDIVVPIETISETKATGDCDIEIDLDVLGDEEGYCYLELECLSNKGTLYSGYLYTNEETNKELKIAIVICTYKREEYVKNNLNRLNDYFKNDKELKDIFDVYVVDNAQTIKDLPGDNVTIIPNRNLGGSGGFTRGIYEAYLTNKYSHFLLQDDDILFDPFILKKVVAYLRFAKNDSLNIGASMLELNNWSYQTEMGADWDKFKIVSFNRGYQLSRQIDLLRNEKEHKYGYSGWWFLCSPMNIVDKFGLPLPLFIKGDDIEYGLRTIDELLVINGIGVWHEAFYKKYAAHLEYYYVRNELIVEALHRKHSILSVIKKLLPDLASQLFRQRYEECDYLIRGVYDFLKGPDYLLSLKSDEFNVEIRKNEVVKYTKEQLLEQGYNVDKMKFYEPKKSSVFIKMITLNGYLIPSIFCEKNPRLIPLSKYKPKYYYKTLVAVNYDPENELGFVTKRSFWEAFICTLKFIKLAVVITAKYRRVASDYVNKSYRLSNINMWQDIFKSLH